jgi:CRISPR-associated endonuclease/helicase Cas3
MQPVAHISEDQRYHFLQDHLLGTAKLASEFAREFGCAEWGYLAGLWHDLGKYSDDFQQMIRSAADNVELKQGKPQRVDHSTAGAIHAVNSFNSPGGLPLGTIFAYLLAGHHAGLPDWQASEASLSGLVQRIRKINLLEAALTSAPPEAILQHCLLTEKPKPGIDIAFWIRMLFSCVVDADFLDTEAFFDTSRQEMRKGYPQISELLPKFEKFMKYKRSASKDTPVNRMREEILNQCVIKSQSEPAIFTLTVPTGGGKTLSSMAFALNHAVKHNKRRIIYVIPYTSIIEQTADQFRNIFGDSIIEHHSNFDPGEDTEGATRHNLASENWDAPIIITTSVQFFESMFASRTSRCRKLHNIVNSVVILDEVQLLPPEFLNPIIETLKELYRNYGVSLLLCTATQPALSHHKSFDFDFRGLPNMVEIMEDPSSLHEQFKRVTVSMPPDLTKPTNWDDLSASLQQHPSVLCIVNRRDDCRTLFAKMPVGTIHLSALMCGAHRSIVIAEIKNRLQNNIPTRVISTQLVEAGVDIDFPIVYRAISGLDSVAQAAGRCNREGRLTKGQMFIFVPPSKIPPGYLRQAGEIARRLLAANPEDPLALDLFERFFRELYWLQGDNLDKHGILKDLAFDREFRFSFRSAAEKFRLIDESMQFPVLVKYGKGNELIETLIKRGPERWLLRKLQRYVVNIPRYLQTKLPADGAIIEFDDGIYIQGHDAAYDDTLGFCSDRVAVYAPDDLVC